MKHEPRHRRFAAWLALAGLLLQIGLTTAHSARHFDHLVGSLGEANAALAAEEPHPVPTPDGHKSPGLDRCAIDFCLAAAGNGVLADPGRVPLPLSFAIARLEGASQAIVPTSHRHSLPPARAPPVIEIA